jgi:uncharacterized phage protein (TIGR02218 family)
MSKTLPGAISTMIAGETLSLSTGLRLELTQFQPKLTAITAANPAACTTDTVHNFTTGDVVVFRNIEGMTEIEGLDGVVTVTGASTFTVDIDASLFTAFVAGTGRSHAVLGFTDFTKQLTLGKLPLEPSIAYSPTAIANSNDLAVDNVELQGIIDDEGITDEDLIAGTYDYALITFYLVDNTNAANFIILKRGRIGEVSQERDLFFAEFRGLSALLTQDVVKHFMPSCRVELGSTACGVDLSTFEVSGTVSAVTNRRKFEDTSLTDADGYFDEGKIRWLTGNNAGREMEVRAYLLTDPTNPSVTLLDRMAEDIQVSDTYTMTPGCNKSIATCQGTYTNIANHRGFPHMPGVAELMSYGNRTAE